MCGLGQWAWGQQTAKLKNTEKKDPRTGLDRCHELVMLGRIVMEANAFCKPAFRLTLRFFIHALMNVSSRSL
jgi:hypothetical protein